MKKRGQHYVWRKYLKAWASNNLIWCYREGKVFCSNLRGVGQSRDFYKLKELTLQDIEVIIKHAVEPSKGHLRELNKGWVQLFNTVFQLKSWTEKMGVNNPEVDKFLDEAIHNIEEDYHSIIESSAIKYINSILDENVDFYNTEEGCKDFAYYLCVQYMRTKKRQESIFKIFRDIDTVNIENAWRVMRHIYASNMAWVLFAEREYFRIVLVRNQSNVPFITGDQPVINTYAVGKLDNEVVNDFEFYYPVSPKLAVLISERNEYKTIRVININDKEAHAYNRSILDSSHEQIFSNSKKVLEEYCLQEHESS